MARYPAAKARMSKQELILVKYVVRQLTAAYTDARGKGRYARNMDQVMKDIFGIKRFTKCLERGIRNESDMISLMRAMDFQTIWTICRSSEHYRMLCSLVAMDSAIVKLQKKSDEYLTLNPQDRPGRKYAKAQKELKRLQKSYNRTVKVFREIFDIKSKNAGSTLRGIMEYAENWRDRNTMGDGIFDYFDDTPMMDTVESMDAFIRRNQPRGGRDVKRPDRGGALGIFDDEVSYAGPDDDEDYFDMDDDQQSTFTAENMDELVDRLAAIIQQRYPTTSPVKPQPKYTYPNTQVPVMTPPPPVNAMPNDVVMSRMLQMQEEQGQLLGQLIDVLSGNASNGGGSGDIYEEDLGDVMTRRAPGSDVSMEEALNLANGTTELPPEPTEETTEPPQS